MTFDEWCINSAKNHPPTLLEAWNAGYRSFCDEICPTCGQTRQHAGGGCIHCITEDCKNRVKAAEAARDAMSKTLPSNLSVRNVALMKENAALRKERDELVAALEHYRNIADPADWSKNPAQKALANVRKP